MPDLLKPFFDDVQRKNWPKTGKIFTVCSGPASQSIGVVELVAREPALIFLFAKVENGVTKSCQILRRKNRKNAILAWSCPLFWAGSLVTSCSCCSTVVQFQHDRESRHGHPGTRTSAWQVILLGKNAENVPLFEFFVSGVWLSSTAPRSPSSQILLPGGHLSREAKITPSFHS